MSWNRFFGCQIPAGISILSLVIYVFITGCQPSEDNHPDVELNWSIEPEPPVTGTATIHFTLTDSTDHQISGADIHVEGNMSHPGMQPVHSEAEETEPGKYSAEIVFTMGGDWYLLVESKLPDDRIVERQIDIPGVRSQ